ncbi:GNAT family N-acetyltransferase [Oryzobacter telluris]|uniref:GNAT family N-acetyltransferase n=1 Tax=Oryzobacter telluris TaxID=3149179 RepID=UPI00370D87C7
MATLRDGTVHDLPGVYRVCRLTGLAGQDASAVTTDPDLLGHVWAGHYLLAPGAIALVVQDEQGVAGYCLAAPDTATHEAWVEERWLPPLRARHPRGTGTGLDATLVEHLHDPPRTDLTLLADHPAHLHIDLLPRLQGRGWGRRLLEDMTARLAAAGASGVHLGVDHTNTGAVAFYERLGFTELRQVPGTHLLGRRLT